jgi:predicted RNA methylase
MDWVKKHYTKQSRLFGRATISDRHRDIANGLHRWFKSQQNSRGNRVLELGAGACGLAAAITEYGYDVWAVEFNQADVELAKKLVKGQH